MYTFEYSCGGVSQSVQLIWFLFSLSCRNFCGHSSGSKQLFKNRACMTAYGRKSKPIIILCNPIDYISVQSANAATIENRVFPKRRQMSTMIGRFLQVQRVPVMAASTVVRFLFSADKWAALVTAMCMHRSIRLCSNISVAAPASKERLRFAGNYCHGQDDPLL